MCNNIITYTINTKPKLLNKIQVNNNPITCYFLNL